MKKINQKTGSKEISYEERLEIKKYIKKSFSVVSIARLINRPASSVKNEISRNGGRNYYSAELAQKRADTLKKVRYQKTIDLFSKEIIESDDEILKLKERIENLEFQMEIILDFIKEKND